MTSPDKSQVSFVAGATGYTGRAVVRTCCEQGLRTVAHIRPDSKSLDRFKKEFEAQGAVVDTTPWDGPAMTETLTRLNPTYVFSLLGTTRARAAKEGMSKSEGYDAIDYGLSRLLLDALQPAEGTKFIYLSSLGANSESRIAYMRVRGAFERQLKHSGHRYVIAQPSFISGPDREDSRALERGAAIIADGALATFSLVGGKKLRGRYRSLTGTALAQGLVQLALENHLAMTAETSEILEAAHRLNPARP